MFKMKVRKMTTIDLVGVPIPITHPEFCKDAKLHKKIKQLESFIEIIHDFREAKEAFAALNQSVKKENEKSINALFKCIPWQISEALLSYIVVLYSKAFTAGTGRTRLDGQVNEIFGADVAQHNYTIDLRNGFYAHHGIEANRHQLFCFPNSPSIGKVRLNPNGFTTRIVMPLSIQLEKIEFCLTRVEEYLIIRIHNLCKDIEDNLSKEQIDVLNKTSKDELLKEYWRNITGINTDPFAKRVT